jgi:hypothetical protein
MDFDLFVGRLDRFLGAKESCQCRFSVVREKQPWPRRSGVAEMGEWSIGGAPRGPSLLNLASNALLQIISSYADILLRQLLNPFLLVDGEAAHYLAGGTQNQ